MGDFSQISAAIWRRNEFQNDELDARLAGITAYSISKIMGSKFTEIHHSHSIESILLACQTDWCFIQASGHTYRAQNVSLARNILAKMVENDEVAAIAHLMDDKVYFGLHHQVMLLNKRLWEEHGRPIFGGTVTTEQAVRPVRRSDENVHDDYTPLWLAPASGPPIQVKPKTVGWNFISHMSGLGYSFDNFKSDFRSRKFFCYPQKKNSAAMLEALRDTSQRVEIDDPRIASVAKRFRINRPSGIHIVNNEGNGDIPPPSGEAVGLAVFVASGFKSNIILHKLGFNADTEVVFYDVDQATLEFKKRLIAHWNGQNFLDTANQMIEELKSEYKTNKFTDVNIDLSYQSMIKNSFGSEAAWIDHWMKFRQLRFSFVKADILRDQQPLVNALPDAQREGRPVLWTSNIFNYGIEIIGMEFQARKNAHASLLGHMRAACGREPVFVGQAPRDYASGTWV